MKVGNKAWKLIRSFVLFVFESVFSTIKGNKPIDKTKIKKILIMPPGGIGDMVLVFPAMAALQDNFPGASITIVTARTARKVLSLSRQSDNLDEIVDYVYSNPNAKFRTIVEKFFLILWLRAKRFDLIYSTGRGGGLRLEPLMNFWIGAPHRLGFKGDSARSLNTVAIEFKEDIPILEQNLAVLKAAGLKITNEKIELHVPEKDMLVARGRLLEAGLEDSYPLVAIHPGAAFMANFKSWPIENYISLIKILLQENNAKVVLIGSPGETSIADEIIRQVDLPDVISLAGKTTIAEMAGVIKLSRLFIGNDSGPLHLATALAKPAIGLFGPTSPAQILSGADSCIVIKRELACSPCYTHMDSFSPPCNSQGHPECMKDIRVSQVADAAKRLLSVSLMEVHSDAKLSHI